MSFTRQRGNSRESGHCRLLASADMGIYGAETNHRSLAALLDEFPGFEIDLSEVDDIDCSGIQLLLAAARQAELAGKPFRLHSPSPAVEDVFRLLAIFDRFQWTDPAG